MQRYGKTEFRTCIDLRFPLHGVFHGETAPCDG